MNPTLPRQLGPYRLVRRLGYGGMCEVFLGTAYGASGFEKRVAVKTLLPELRGNPSFERQLIAEATLGARLQHRNLVQIHDFGVEEGVYYVRMDYVDGADLHTLCRVERPRAEIALFIAAEIALALDYLHACTDGAGRSLGLVHRDVSPSNILVSTSGEVKLADFGIAKATRRADNTRGNVHKGKYAYMSPEQIDNSNITAQSDQFGLGVTLMELLCGRRPFEAEGPLETMELIRSGAPPDLDGLKPAFRALINHCLSHAPEHRFKDAGSLYRAITRIRRQLPPAGPHQLATWLDRSLATIAAERDAADRDADD